MTIADLIAVLSTFDSSAEVRLSVKGHHVAQPVIGLGTDAAGRMYPVIADREKFAGKVKDP